MALQFTPTSFQSQFLGDKQPFLQANFVMNFNDERFVPILQTSQYNQVANEKGEENPLSVPEDLSVFGFSSTIPASVINVLDLPYIGGFRTPVPGKIQPNSVDLLFFENNKFSCSNFFETWRLKTVEAYPDSPNIDLVESDSNEIKLDFDISLLNNAREVKSILKIKRAFPVAVSTPVFSWAAAQSLPVIQVSLVYDYYEMHNPASSSLKT